MIGHLLESLEMFLKSLQPHTVDEPDDGWLFASFELWFADESFDEKVSWQPTIQAISR